MQRYSPRRPTQVSGVAPLDVSVRISTVSGWLDLENADGGYELEASTRGDRNVSWRAKTVSNDFVEGSYLVSAVRENVTENVSVWVTGDTPWIVASRLAVLTAALEQFLYTVIWRVGDAAEYWTCQPAAYSLTTQREFLHGNTGLVKAQIPRLPSVVSVMSTSEEL